MVLLITATINTVAVTVRGEFDAEGNHHLNRENPGRIQ
jgi:hypothetical protein